MAAGDYGGLAAPVALSPPRRLWPGVGFGSPLLVVWLPALLVGLALLLPLAYLVIRGASANEEAWSLLFRARTAQILGRSALLVVTVTSLSVLIAVPIAWLTTRTDLPLRRFWAKAATDQKPYAVRSSVALSESKSIRPILTSGIAHV